MDQLPIADAHVHFWDLAHHRYPWLEPAEPQGPFGKTSRIRNTYQPDDYLADAARQNVTRMVHIEAGWDPADPLGEMRWIQATADRRGVPHAHVAHVDLAAEDAAELIDEHARYPLFRGVRDRLQDGDFTGAAGTMTRIDDPRWLRGMRILDRLNLCFDLQAPPALMAKAAVLAHSYPGVNFILTHAAYPPSPDDHDAYARWADGVAGLAERPNVAIKLSGLMLGEKSWNANHAERSANELIRCFGPDRVLIASNFPVDRLFASLDELFGNYRRWLSAWPETDQRSMLHDNTCRLYHLDGGSRIR
jgi:predicted TIM-barrel fold metal-dependent hydrolase